MCFFSVGRCVPIRCYWDLKLIGSVGWGWQGMAGLVGWLGWLGWLGPSPGFLPLCGVCGGGREETVGGGVGTVRYMCIIIVF